MSNMKQVTQADQTHLVFRKEIECHVCITDTTYIAECDFQRFVDELKEALPIHLECDGTTDVQICKPIKFTGNMDKSVEIRISKRDSFTTEGDIYLELWGWEQK